MNAVPSDASPAPPGTAFTDPSCYHAALGTLLLEHDPEAEPALVLGSTAATRAELVDGNPVFSDLVPGLIEVMAAAGHRVVRERLADGAGLDRLRELLTVGGPLVAVLDTFHLEHYWVDRGRVHAPHAVALRQYDPVDGTVRLTDAVDVTRTDRRVELHSLEAALLGRDVGQGWLTVTAWGPRAAAEPRWAPAAHAAALSGRGGARLSGVELATGLRESLDDLFAVTPRLSRPDARSGPDDDRRRVTRLLRGMWNYHHTLRWFGRHLRALPDQGGARATAAAAVDQASQDWLAARAMVLHSGVANRDRAARYRDEVARRLGRVAGNLQAAGDLLNGAGRVLPWKG